MSRLACTGCAAFNRDEPTAPAIERTNLSLPAEAQCRRTAPPWSIVKATDWCMAWTPRRDTRQLPDDGA